MKLTTATATNTNHTCSKPKMITSPISVLHTSHQDHIHIEDLFLTKPSDQNMGSQNTNEPEKKRQKSEHWVCPVSSKAERTVNPARKFIDPLASKIKTGAQRADRKNPISLASGDATQGANLPPCKAAMEAIVRTALYRPHAAGYAHACGIPAARGAIAVHHSYPEVKISPESVIIASGCSGALELALSSLLDPGTAILVPQPGFPLYQEIAESLGATVIHYRLRPEQKWECDLECLEEILQKPHNIRALVVNNPSSPTGSVFSEKHLTEILDVVLKYQLPIVSDEVYGDLVYGESKFHPMAQVAAKAGQQVPIITTSGLSKQYLLPGWRVGWLTFNDNTCGSLKGVEAGARRLAQLTLGASHPVQSVIPSLLNPRTPGILKWKANLRKILESQAECICSKLSSCPGLEVIDPQGAMYAIVKIDTQSLGLQDDMDFAMKLIEEENVFVLPGSAFGVKNMFRVVFSSSEPVLDMAARRISDFCNRHHRSSLGSTTLLQ